MAQQIRFRLDGTIYGGIANPMDFGVTIAEEPTLQYRFVSFDNDIRFIGDGYAYLNNLIESDCGCDLVSVDVEYLCGQTSWQRLCTGFIILAECVTNYDKCEITTKLFDNTFATLINNNKAIPFSLRSEFTKNLQAVVPPNYKVLDLFVPATGVYDTTNFVYGIRVEDAFTQLVACMTDNRVDVSTPPFATGTFENLMVLNGRQILSPQLEVATKISFEQLFLALRTKLNISLGSTLQANGRPLLTIDFASNLNNQTESIDLVSLSGVIKKQDTSRLYSSVNFGNQEYFEQWQCNSGDNACTFAQTPFYGFRDEVFGILGNCNKNIILDISTQDVIFDTNIIEDIFVWGNQSFADNPIIINSTQSLVPTIFKATQGDPYAIGQTVYNAEFTNQEVAQYWIGGVPNSVYIYNSSYDWGCSITTVKNNRTSPTWETWVIQFPDYTGFRELNGTFPKFEDIVSDVCGNWINDNEYRVPRTGLYTVNLQMVITPVVALGNPDKSIYAVVEHYNSNDEIINIYDWTNSTGAIVTGTGSLIANRDVSFVANEGDYIRANVYGALQSTGSTVALAINNTFVTDDTEMFIQGQPIITGDELQPYDPCDYKNYLYDFEAPLSMDKIQLMLNNPSAPIKFSRTPTINNGITGLCNQVTIDSIIRQNASFTLRSSQKL